jgi:hypothetical protein
MSRELTRVCARSQAIDVACQEVAAGAPNASNRSTRKPAIGSTAPGNRSGPTGDAPAAASGTEPCHAPRSASAHRRSSRRPAPARGASRPLRGRTPPRHTRGSQVARRCAEGPPARIARDGAGDAWLSLHARLLCCVVTHRGTRRTGSSAGRPRGRVGWVRTSRSGRRPGDRPPARCRTPFAARRSRDLASPVRSPDSNPVEQGHHDRTDDSCSNLARRRRTPHP